jgi:hypothetical protein
MAVFVAGGMTPQPVGGIDEPIKVEPGDVWYTIITDSATGEAKFGVSNKPEGELAT